ncbi:MAG: EAL domain-containing protein [Pseudomonadota bacterium]
MDVSSTARLSQAPRAPPRTILIIDDDEFTSSLLSEQLEATGYLTNCAADGHAALARIASNPPDLIVLDVMMPGMNGYELTTLLKGSMVTASIPIIIVTGLTAHSARLDGLTAGADEVLIKPVDHDELWLKVRNLLRSKVAGDELQDRSWTLGQQVAARTLDLQRFRAAMDVTADAIFLVERNSMRFIEFNAAAHGMFGYTRAELLRAGPAALADMTTVELAERYDKVIGGLDFDKPSETWLRRKDGSMLQVEVQRQAQRWGKEWIIVGVVRDITDRMASQQRLHQLAHYDALTGLPNRQRFEATLQAALVRAGEGGAPFGVMLIDLDRFKRINDGGGRNTGDELLRQVGARLIDCVRLRDAVGRLGDNEFALILGPHDGLHGAAHLASHVRDVLRQPFQLDGQTVSITASIGIAVFPDDAQTPELLIKHAGTAMQWAKVAGRDTFRFFTAAMHAEAMAGIALESALREAVEQEQFVLMYQPKVCLDDGRMCGVEALLRWRRPGVGLVGPQHFMAVLEETGLIVEVGRWVIQAACRQAGAWSRAGIACMPISVNVAGRQFIEGDLEADVLDALNRSGIEGNLLELELTESSLMENTERTISILANLRKTGVRIAIDDFGTGYSSLAYLRRFPIDKLKIDIAFIRDVTSDPDDAAIVLAIIGMAHSLKMEVIAEGVETEAQLAYLRRKGCDQIQGFHFSAPLEVDGIEQLLGEGRRLPTVGGAPNAVKTLLLVDDESHVLASLRRLLRQDGYRILCAQSAAEGFDMLALNEVQVIVCDQRMPAMSGTEFLGRVKEIYPDTFRIVLSGYTELLSILEAINRGAIYRFYTKPWDNQSLRVNIADAFRQHALLHA